MPSPPVLVVTGSRDHYTVDRVADALAERDVGVVRFDTDRYPLTARLSVPAPAGAPALRDRDGDPIDLASVRAVWLRQLWPATLDPALDERFHEACRRQCADALLASLASVPARRWVNGLDALRLATDKMRQLRAASSAGLRIPRTLLSADPDAVRAFHADLGAPMIAKLLRATVMSVGPSEQFVHTTTVGAEDLARLDTLRHAPMLFQERIEKAAELRVVCVGDACFAGAVENADDLDWRAGDPRAARWAPAEVPPAVRDALLAVNRALGLVYGAADIIRTPEGEHVFLEVNPAGEWGMLERDLGLPISRALADALLADPVPAPAGADPEPAP